MNIDEIGIASPCKANWNEMAGDDRVRFCFQCKLNVYNLSGLTRTEVSQLLISNEGRVCIRMYRRKDGTLLTRDCPVGARQGLIRRLFVAAAGLIVLGGAAIGGLFLERKQLHRDLVEWVRPKPRPMAPRGVKPPDAPERYEMGKMQLRDQR